MSSHPTDSHPFIGCIQFGHDSCNDAIKKVQLLTDNCAISYKQTSNPYDPCFNGWCQITSSHNYLAEPPSSLSLWNIADQCKITSRKYKSFSDDVNVDKATEAVYVILSLPKNYDFAGILSMI